MSEFCICDKCGCVLKYWVVKKYVNDEWWWCEGDGSFVLVCEKCREKYMDKRIF